MDEDRKNRALVENVKGQIAEAHKEIDEAKKKYQAALIYEPENDEYINNLERVENLNSSTTITAGTQGNEE